MRCFDALIYWVIHLGILEKRFFYSLNAKVNRSRRVPTLAIKMPKAWPMLASALNRKLERCHFKASLGAAEELMAFARLLLADGRR